MTVEKRSQVMEVIISATESKKERQKCSERK